MTAPASPSTGFSILWVGFMRRAVSRKKIESDLADVELRRRGLLALQGLGLRAQGFGFRALGCGDRELPLELLPGDALQRQLPPPLRLRLASLLRVDPLGFERAQHRRTPRPSLDGTRSKTLCPFGSQQGPRGSVLQWDSGVLPSRTGLHGGHGVVSNGRSVTVEAPDNGRDATSRRGQSMVPSAGGDLRFPLREAESEVWVSGFGFRVSTFQLRFRV